MREMHGTSSWDDRQNRNINVKKGSWLSLLKYILSYLLIFYSFYILFASTPPLTLGSYSQNLFLYRLILSCLLCSLIPVSFYLRFSLYYVERTLQLSFMGFVMKNNLFGSIVPFCIFIFQLSSWFGFCLFFLLLSKLIRIASHNCPITTLHFCPPHFI